MNPHTATSFVDILRWRAEHQPDRKAFLFLQDGEVEGASVTYAELDQQARAVAARLGSSETIVQQALLLYPPGLEFIAAFCGCLYAGAAAVPLQLPRPKQSLARLQAVAVDSAATVVLSTSSQLPGLLQQAGQDAVLARLQWVGTDTLPIELATEWRPPSTGRDALAFLQYTSGSTGTPKGVMVSHGNLIQNSEYLRNCFELSPESVSVCWLPSFHDMGLVDGVLQPLYTGFLGVIMPPVSFLQTPARWLDAITRYRGTHCGGPNFAYDLCVRKVTPQKRASLDLSSWVTAYNGAEPVSRHTLERFNEHFRPCGFQPRYFYPCYGMAEATLIVSGGRVAEEPKCVRVDGEALERGRVVEAHSGSTRIKDLVSCGRPWLDTEIVIADPHSMQRCPAGSIGEIWVAGASVARGYRNRPELSAETFGAHLTDTGEGPFLRTGDLGFISNGELFVNGRIKDVIIIRGQNYYPQDIEQTVQDSYPGFRPACGAAFSVDVNDEERLIVVQEVERTHLRHLDARAALKAIREAVANEHGIQVYLAVLINPATIPKTSSGKIQRHACRAQYLAGALVAVGGAPAMPTGSVAVGTDR